MSKAVAAASSIWLAGRGAEARRMALTWLQRFSIGLKSGETRKVTFSITTEDLKFYNSDLKYDWEPGEFFIRIGGNSSQLKSAVVLWRRQTSAAKAGRVSHPVVVQQVNASPSPASLLFLAKKS